MHHFLQKVMNFPQEKVFPCNWPSPAFLTFLFGGISANSQIQSSTSLRLSAHSKQPTLPPVPTAHRAEADESLVMNLWPSCPSDLPG